MEEKIIGVIWRYGKNDYQISLADFDQEDQNKLLEIDDKYSEKYSCERGDENLTIKAANIEYWENGWAKQERLAKQKKLATKLYDVGMLKTDVLYDHSNDDDDQMTVVRIREALENPRDTAYLLEVFAQLCDGSQENEDHKMFFECMMDIIHYMEDYQKGDN